MYEGLTPEYIKSDILDGLALADTREGSYTNLLVSPVAYEIWKLYKALDAVVPMVYVDETSGIYIDMRAAEYGVTRKAGTKATAAAAFEGMDGTAIAKGKVFMTADSLQYTLDETVTISGGEAAGRLTATEIGEKYNAPAGAIFRQVNNQTGITAVISGAAEGGADAETDKALAERFYAYLKRPPTSGNAAHYEYWAKEVDGIENVKVMPLWAGPGTVKLLVVGPGNQPVDGAAVSKAAAHIEAARPIGADVTVASAAGLPIDVAAALSLKPSTDAAAVQGAFAQALSAYLEGLAFVDYTVVYNRIGHILMGLPGVVDFSALAVNGAAADVIVGPDEVPVVGNIVVS
jgi:uncharacterized phage protein gp47/JayE